MSAPYKVYIIDEAHMLTPEAFNALLKTLEEPPAHVVIILATTEFAKLPSTIVSRLQKFSFKRATKDAIKESLLKIAKEEKIKIDESAIGAIAQASDGSFRDAVSILDQVSSQSGEVSRENISAIVRVSGWNLQLVLAQFLAGSNLKEAVLAVENLAEEGVDFELFVRQFVLFLEKVLLLKIGVGVSAFDIDEDQLTDLKSLSEKFDLDRLEQLMRLMLVSEGEMNIYPIAHMPVVLAFCKFVGEVEEEVSNVENVSINRNALVSNASKVQEVNADLPSEKAEKRKRCQR